MSNTGLPIGVAVGADDRNEASVYIDIGPDAEGNWAISAEAAREFAKQLNAAADMVDGMKQKN